MTMRILLALGCGLGVLVVVLLGRTFLLGPRHSTLPRCTPGDRDRIKADQARLDHFQTGLRLQTISRAVGDYNKEELVKLLKHIKQSYPTVHSSPLVTQEVIANYSLLYTIRGSDPSLTPYMLTAHLDVVPESPGHWTEPPFSANIRDGYIYARGTIDVKQSVFGILEALEYLLQNGFQPKRSFYVGFGHDEEITGLEGAYNIGRVLAERGVRLEYLIDEGLTVVEGVVPGIDVHCGLIGTSEKGFLTLKLSVTTEGGHSSMPGKESSIGILASALHRLESSPHPSMFGTGPEVGMLEHLSPEMKLPQRIVMSNLWLFSPIVSRILSGKPSSNALLRTTTALTEFHAGIKSNVLAPTATATVNHRIHPSQSVQEVLEYDRQIINDDRVQIEVESSMEPLPRSRYDDDAFGYQMIKSSILQVWGYLGVIVAPGLMVGNTDTKHYSSLTDNIYRFSPTVMSPEDIPRFHGLNERMSVQNYEEAMNFFYHLILNSDNKELEPVHQHGSDL